MRDEIVFARKKDDSYENDVILKMVYDADTEDKIYMRFSVVFKFSIITSTDDFSTFLSNIVKDSKYIARTKKHDLHLSRFFVSDIDNNLSHKLLGPKLVIFKREKNQMIIETDMFESKAMYQDVVDYLELQKKEKKTPKKEIIDYIKKRMKKDNKYFNDLCFEEDTHSETDGNQTVDYIIKWCDIERDGKINLCIEKQLPIHSTPLRYEPQDIEELDRFFSFSYEDKTNYQRLISRYRYLSKLRALLGEVVPADLFAKTQDIIDVSPLQQLQVFPMQLRVCDSVEFKFKSLGLAVNTVEQFDTHDGFKKNGNLEFYFSNDNFGNCFFFKYENFDEIKSNLLWNSIIFNFRVLFLENPKKLIEEQIAEAVNTFHNDDYSENILIKVIYELKLQEMYKNGYNNLYEPTRVNSEAFEIFYKNLKHMIKSGIYSVVSGKLDKFDSLITQKKDIKQPIKHTEICYFFKKGTCKDGQKCKWSHEMNTSQVSQSKKSLHFSLR